MYPTVVTTSWELNIPYINELLILATLEPEIFRAKFNPADPEFYHNCRQLLIINTFIQSWIINVIVDWDSLRVETDQDYESDLTLYIHGQCSSAIISF